MGEEVFLCGMKGMTVGKDQLCHISELQVLLMRITHPTEINTHKFLMHLRAKMGGGRRQLY